MAYQLFVPPSRAIDVNGNPLSGAKWFFYTTDTLTPATVYTSSTLSVALPNPVVADAGGAFANIYLDPAVIYRAILKDATEAVTYRDIDPLEQSADPELREDLADPAIGSRLIAPFEPRISGGQQTTGFHFFRASPVLLDEAILAGEDVTTHADRAIRRILAAGEMLKIPGDREYTINPDPASALSGGTLGYAWGIKVPSNARILIDPGAVFKQADEAPAWCRTFSFEDADNVAVEGTLEIDGNVDNINALLNNEHQHCAFFFDTKNVYVERLVVRNARGDGVYFGGTDDTNGSTGDVGSIHSSRCGRKSLVGQAFDVRIDNAWCDNSTGGAALFGGTADATDGSCLDIEPDALTTGATQNRMRIGSLYTKGAGNDITGGITAALRSKIRLDVDNWECEIVPRATTPWLTAYGNENDVKRMSVTGVTGTSLPATVYYAAKLRIGDLTLKGASSSGTNGSIEISQVGGDRPEVEIARADVDLTGGSAFYVQDAKLSVGHFHIRAANIAIWARGMSSTTGLFAEVKIDHLEIYDTGDTGVANYAVVATKAGSNQTIVDVGQVTLRDSRATKLGRIFYLGVGASAGVSIGAATIDNATTQLFAGDGPEKYIRTSGPSNGPASYISLVDPNGTVLAKRGSDCAYIGTGRYHKITTDDTANWTAL